MLVPRTVIAHNKCLFLGSTSGWLKWQVSAYQSCRYFTLLARGQKLGPVHSLSYRKSGGTASFVITTLQYVCLPSGFGNTFDL